MDRWGAAIPPSTVVALDAAGVMAENCLNEGGRPLAVEHAHVLRERDALRLEVAELRASRMRLALADDAERRDIERALHEGVQQLLVTLATDIELAVASVSADPALALLADLRRDVQQALEETRKLAERIYPPLLEAGGLSVALRSAAARLGVPIRIDVTVSSEYPLEVVGPVYACCLDVLDRADAGTSVEVTVRHESEAVTFEIVAACVVDPAPLVRDRVEAFGGRVTFREDGHQTRVTGSLPLRG